MYHGSLGQIEKLLQLNCLDEKHPYYDLYNYILYLRNKDIVINLIKKKLNERLSHILNYEKEITFQNIGVEFKNFPTLGKLYSDIYEDDFKKINCICNLEDEDINNIIQQVYNRVVSNEDIFYSKKQVDYLKNKIINDCYLILSTLKYKGFYVIEKNENGFNINKDILYEIFEKFDYNMLNSIGMIIEDNYKKRKKWRIIDEYEMLLINYREYINYKIVSILKKKIDNMDRIILGQIEDDCLKLKKSEIRYLERENILRYANGAEKIVVSYDRLMDLKISSSLFDILNERCRLEMLISYFSTSHNFDDFVVDGEIQEFIDKGINDITFEGLSINDIEHNQMIEELYRSVYMQLQEKIVDCRKKVIMLENNQNLLKDARIKEIENDSNSNIQCLLESKIGDMPTGLNAIYMLYVLMKIEDNLLNDDLDDFISNKKNVKITAGFETMVSKEISEILEKRFDESSIQKKRGEL